MIKFARFSTRHAEQYEDDLHHAFNRVRFEQTAARRVVKFGLQLAYIYICYYALSNYILEPTAVNDALNAFVFVFFVLFHAEVKIGITGRTTEQRLSEVNDDMTNGYTEWFAIPWPLALCIPFVTWFKVNPLAASLAVCSVGVVLYFLTKNI